MTPEFFFSCVWMWWHRVCPIAHTQRWHLSLFFFFILLRMWVLNVYCWNAFEFWEAHTSDNVCELKGREMLHLPGLSSFPRISYWCLPGRGFRSQTFCLKNPFLFTCLPQSHQFSSAFPETHEKSLYVRGWWWRGGVGWRQLTLSTLSCAR